jgi:hypothetical protein
VDDILTLVVGEELPDRPFGGFLRIRSADEPAKIRNRVLLLKRNRHARAARHELNQPFVERASFVNCIECTGNVSGQAHLLEAQHLESGLLNTPQEFALELLSKTIRLQDR